MKLGPDQGRDKSQASLQVETSLRGSSSEGNHSKFGKLLSHLLKLVKMLHLFLVFIYILGYLITLLLCLNYHFRNHNPLKLLLQNKFIDVDVFRNDLVVLLTLSDLDTCMTSTNLNSCVQSYEVILSSFF